MSILSKVLLSKFLLNQAKNFRKSETAQNATSIAGVLGSAAVMTSAVKNLKRKKGTFSKISNIVTLGSAAFGIFGGLKYLLGNNSNRKKGFLRGYRKKKKFAII